MIDIIIPAYNCSQTLNRTLGSLVAQTDSDFKVIIVDDCSTENIKPIIDRYIGCLDINYIRNEKNIGCGMSRQVGIDNATNKFITFLDSDDVFMPYTVETFNSIIEADPNTEYIHSYFYEQVNQDGNPALFLWKDNYTACHGKLYNIDMINKYGIKNSPEVKWADDSYFNSMCSELMRMSVIKIPTMVWCNNKNSVMRSVNPQRDAASKEDFLNAMIMSAEFVLKKKGHIDHLQNTVEGIIKYFSLNKKEEEKLNKLLNMCKGGS